MRKQSKKEKDVIDKFKRDTRGMSSSQIIEYMKLSEVEKEKYIRSINCINNKSEEINVNQIIEPQIQTQHISHDNHIKDDKFKEEENDDSNIRSEQIIISEDNYPTISDSDSQESIYRSIDNISGCNHFSKNIYNQCLYQIRQSFFNKIDIEGINKVNANINNDKEKNLRSNIKKLLDKYKNHSFEKLKSDNYKNQIYKLLDKYFKEQSKNRNITNDNYSWSPQAAQQIIDMSVEAWLDNDLARRDYKENPEHRADYTGEPGLPNYRKGSEYISVFTNQQCHIENRDIFDSESMFSENQKWTKKHFLMFPDHLNIKPIETRLSNKTDLREVRIIPLIRKGFYKIELVTKKVIDRIKIKLLNLDPNRIVGIDTGQENVVTIASNIGLEPIIIKGGILLSINQWFDKIGSKLYRVYCRQQKHQKGKKEKVKMGEKMKKLSFDRTNSILDILHKISRYIVNYCTNNKVGTIVWGRNPGWKQNINLGKRTNQKFTKIPHYILFKLLKYKAEEIGIKVIDIEESHTSKCSFQDFETIGHHEKYMGKRIKRGLFRTLKGIILNADVNAAYNMIRKVFPDAFNILLKTVGIVTPPQNGGEGVVLHPLRLSVSDLLSTSHKVPNSC